MKYLKLLSVIVVWSLISIIIRTVLGLPDPSLAQRAGYEFPAVVLGAIVATLMDRWKI